MRKKVAFVIKSLQNGGAERVASVLSHAFAEKYDLDIIVFDGREFDYSYSGNLINLRYYELDSRFFKIFHFLKNYLKKRRLAAVKAKNGYDTVISFVTDANILHMQTALPHQNNIVTVHNNVTVQISNQQVRFLSKVHSELFELYQKADHIIAVSEGVKADLVDNFKIPQKNVDVVYNPIDLEQMKINTRQVLEDNKLKEVFDNHEVIVTAGSLNDQKAQWNLIRAYSKVKTTFPNTRLVIFGRGKYHDALTQLINDLHLENDVFLAGYKSSLFTYMGKAKIFALTSTHEGLVMVLLESLGCQLPIIATDCPSGTREILAPNTNITYETQTLEATDYGYIAPLMHKHFTPADVPLSREELLFAEGIGRMLGDEDHYKQMKAAALKRAEAFDIQAIMQIWEQYI